MRKMIWSSYSLAMVLVLGTPALAQAAERYDIDADHSTVVFSCKHAGASYTKGLFRKVSGSFTFDETNPGKSAIEITIPSASIYTNHKKRDQHLQSPDFLNAKQYPTISFKSTSIKKAGKGYQVSGKLSLHGVTKNVTVAMAHVGAGKGPYGKFRRGFEGSFTIKRSDYGMTKMIGPVGDDVELTVSIEGIRK